ncbi:O-antigen polysaccharide polymerase Wzy [Phaeobacter sp. B1627]|uniref:O-antigen polysaccharide polymerase Wzy n=1 Tax=Phaeobacter sp. B1627 TaxID=2583809 RepID=UPI00111A1130|nr:O-antigen polysaccharide polymerase Wzy [Phaeobacter sp. B1627]TNJ40965.1 hypothetical protein FGE21_15815 [Phaeobacter sp. B1627]
MEYLASFLLFLLCLWLFFRMTRARDILDFHLGVIATFSIGYYCLPIWFKELSPLQIFRSYEVAIIAFMFLLFAVCITIGVWVGRRSIPKSVAIMTPTLDRLLHRRMLVTTSGAFLFYIYYYSTQTLTSYSADDFEAFFNNRGPFHAIFSLLSKFSLAWMAIAIAHTWSHNKRSELVLYSAMFGFCLLMLLLVGQRLALLTPLAMLAAALSLSGQSKRAVSMLGVTVLVLLLVSPIAVFIRESLADKENETAQHALMEFSYGDDAFSSIFQSIIDRGDLIYVAVRMKPQIDADPLPGPIYYTSVLLNAIPRAFFPGGFKPYPLSTNGFPSGELSIYSWQHILGASTGSLSAFGGIVAYREFSWAGVVLNGMATGILFVFFARWLGAGGLILQVLYLQVFVANSISKVPPSFFESLLSLMPMLPFIVVAVSINWIIARFGISRRSTTSSPRVRTHSQ